MMTIPREVTSLVNVYSMGHLVNKFNKKLRLVSLCSGSGAGEITFRQACDSLADHFVVALTPSVVLMCEVSKWKRSFLIENLIGSGIDSQCCVFDDIVTLAKGTPTCVRHKKVGVGGNCNGKNCTLEAFQTDPIFLLKSGFSCKSASRANANFGSNLSGVREGNTALSTVRTFHATKQVIVELQPAVYFLENVDSLNAADDSGDSNLSAIMSELQQNNQYAVKAPWPLPEVSKQWVGVFLTMFLFFDSTQTMDNNM